VRARHSVKRETIRESVYSDFWRFNHNILIINYNNMKTALITGIAGGMGYAAAKKLIQEGYSVFGLDIIRPDLPAGLTFINTDLTDPLSIKNAFQEIHSKGVSIDCIIHLAGIYNLDSLVEISDDEFTKIFRTNLFSVYRVNKIFLPVLKKRGRILIVTSELAPLNPLPFTGIYAITKTALDSYARSLQMELQLLGCKVIILRPGAVKTGLLGKSVQALNAFCDNTRLYSCNSEKFRNIVNHIEARNISPDRIADTVCNILNSKRPRQIYSINRNPLLLIMNALPIRFQSFIIKRLIS